jgi:molybdopterin-guanine dinucleotide biosynthesis protein A
MLARNDYKIINFFDAVRLKTIPMEKLVKADPGQRSFINVNTPEAYRSLKGD